MMTLNKNFLSTVGFALTIAFATHSISAHETLSIGGVKYRWSGNSCSFRVDAAMSPGFRSAFQGAINSWNATPANFSFSMTTAPLWMPFTGNLSNEVWLTTNDDLLNGADAVCITNLGTHIVEADIAFDARLTWTSGTSKSVMQAYGGPAMPFRSVAIHELGHALGLKHESDTYNVMGDASMHLQTNGSIARSYVGEDATHGAIYLYGIGNAGSQDLAVSHWRRSGSWRGYSTHARTRLFSGSTECTKQAPVNAADPVYRVRRGVSYDMEMSYENNGATSHRTRLRFCVSTNSFISNGDQYLGERTITVNRNKVYTTRQRVTIPYSLTFGGTYWLGVKIDADGRVREFDETNNATYIRIIVVG